MLLNLFDKLFVIELLKEENIFVIDNLCVSVQDICLLKIVILNLMLLKIMIEMDLVCLFFNIFLQLEILFMKLKSYILKNMLVEYMKVFYYDFDLMCDEKYDGMIIMGVLVEQMLYEDVNYWDEIIIIFDWVCIYVILIFYICWVV